MMLDFRGSQIAALGAIALLLVAGVASADDVADDTEETVNVKLPSLSRPAVHGRLFFDSAFFNADKTALGSGADISAARISVSGKIESSWDYVLQYEFTGSGSLKDAWVRYRLSDTDKIRIGQFQEPFSLEELTSSRFTTFIERALPNAFAPGYHVGGGFDKRGQRVNVSVGVFGESAGTNVPNEGNDGWGAAVRMFGVPVQHEGQILHLGMAANYRQTSSEHTLRFRAHPETDLTRAYLVNTDNISAVHDRYLVGLEGAWISGPWLLQSEYMRTGVNRSDEPNLSFDGGYLYASWFATGESRNYNKSSGTFGRISPKGSGALELAARYSFLNLTDGSVTGGEEQNMTVGVNYYFNAYVRVMADYVHISVDSATSQEHPSAVLGRLQIDF